MDSNDRSRIDLARQKLDQLLSNGELRDAVLLVFGNKKDLPGAMPLEEVMEKLDLNSIPFRTWFIHPSCSVTGDGIQEGLEWLCKAVKLA